MSGNLIRVSPELHNRLKRLQGRFLVEKGIRLTFTEILEAIFSNLTDDEIEQWVKKTIPAPEEEG